MNVILYVEGGGDSKEQHVRCREGFRKLLEKSGFLCCMPRIVAGGGRQTTFDRFRTAVLSNTDPNKSVMMLVDSETPLETPVWEHLHKQDSWDCPAKAGDDQAQLMVTCMETWIMADRAALREFFGSRLNEGALLPLEDLETRTREQVQDSLKTATQGCGRERQYQKGVRSFRVVAQLDPKTLRLHLAHFRRFIDTLHMVTDKS